jgi:DNA-binding NtrC family response regulator
MENRTILFVDDEEKVLKSLQRGLMDEPYKLFFATSGKEALQILGKKEVHVIVTDMRMPEMSGLELLRIVKDKYPKIIRLVLSGYTQVTTLLTAINQGEIFKFITKPWKLEEEFLSVLNQAVEYYNLREERDALLAQLKNQNEEKIPAETSS